MPQNRCRYLVPQWIGLHCILSSDYGTIHRNPSDHHQYQLIFYCQVFRPRCRAHILQLHYTMCCLQNIAQQLWLYTLIESPKYTVGLGYNHPLPKLSGPNPSHDYQLITTVAYCPLTLITMYRQVCYSTVFVSYIGFIFSYLRYACLYGEGEGLSWVNSIGNYSPASRPRPLVPSHFSPHWLCIGEIFNHFLQGYSRFFCNFLPTARKYLINSTNSCP